MREINIDLSSDNYLQQPNIFGGYAGEHNETVLKVKLPARMVNIECSGYRFDFQTSEDDKISSPLIPVSELDNDVVSLPLAEQLTVAGRLLFDVAAIQSNEDDVSLIAKTNMVALSIKGSPSGRAVPIDLEGYKDELNEMVDARIRVMESDLDEHIAAAEAATASATAAAGTANTAATSATSAASSASSAATSATIATNSANSATSSATSAASSANSAATQATSAASSANTAAAAATAAAEAASEIAGYKKTTLDTPLQVNTSYDLGVQSSLTLTLPSTATALDEIYVAFESGSTPTVLAIIGDYVGDDDYEPSANCVCELSFKYVCGAWSLIAKGGTFASINTVLGEIENGYY